MQFKNPYGETRNVPMLGGGPMGKVVEKDEVVDVPEEYAENFVEAGWIAIDKAARQAEKEHPLRLHARQHQLGQTVEPLDGCEICNPPADNPPANDPAPAEKQEG